MEEVKNEGLKLSIRKVQNYPIISANYEVKLNDWEFGHGVTKLNLSMPAGEKPKLGIECFLDEVDIRDLLIEPEICHLEKYVKDNPNGK
ncbi:hypothetical protein FI615_001666 [Enterococcus faecium]|uniref:hypothetical protein n=1 Tax=Enterococcus faecium TaxID=1352 RepID=UPI001A0A8AE9|nr:hypothetical protein [Enterococcus faecium]EGP5600600.1 hypothetical protein [Enterococcus faecium]EHK9936729.1 hypothetical protein [Enterococcus faecium]EME7158830.1 hypothetical protein [Enterococcus faecium]